MLLLSKINSYIIHPFATYSLSLSFFFLILISRIIVILSPTFSLPFTISSSYYYLPYYLFGYCIYVSRPMFHLFFFFFFFRRALIEFQWVLCTVHGTPKPIFSKKLPLKNGPHRTIHSFKNYFVIVFSVFSKISGI